MSSPRPVRAVALLAVLSLPLLTGCAYRGRQAVTAFWADWNTLEQCAGYCENTSHQPLKAYRVDSYRWMYDRDPGQVIVYDAPHPTIFDHLRKHGLLHWIEDEDAHVTRFWKKVRETVENPGSCRDRTCRSDGSCPPDGVCQVDGPGTTGNTPVPAPEMSRPVEPRPAPPVDASAPGGPGPHPARPAADPYRILNPDPVAARSSSVRPSSHAAPQRSAAPSTIAATEPAPTRSAGSSSRWLQYVPPVR